MKMVRTPDARFENLPGYGFRPNYLEVDDGEGGKLRMHHVSEGPAAGPVVLLLHGEPSWSYLYRKMIPPLAAAGCRVVAPDLVGFGRSDKPTQRSDYTYARHVAWVWSCIEQLGLEEITLVCQDWGSLIGLRIAAEHPARFSRIVVGNGGLPTGDAAMSPAFLAWQKYSQEAPVFPAGAIVSRACANKLAPDVIAAYDAPFPDEAYKEGARQFPLLVPCSPGDPASQANRQAWDVLKAWQKPFLTAFSDKDPVTAGGDALMQKLVPGTRGQAHTTIRDAGHFLQEDKGEELAQVVLDFMRKSGASL